MIVYLNNCYSQAPAQHANQAGGSKRPHSSPTAPAPIQPHPHSCKILTATQVGRDPTQAHVALRGHPPPPARPTCQTGANYSLTKN